MLCIKTGMTSEFAVAKRYAASDVLVLTGELTADDLDKTVPATCTGILSFGLCGGLAPQAQIGQTFVYDTAVTPDGDIVADADWSHRLFTATKYYERRCWSSGQFNTANTIAQREQLFTQSSCWIIDDETYAVAMFAKKRGIAWGGLRSVSDGAEDNLPPAVVKALNPDGTDDIEAVIASVVADPAQIPSLVKTAQEFELSLAELRTAAIAVGSNFQWQ